MEEYMRGRDAVLGHVNSINAGLSTCVDIFQWNESYLTNIDLIDDHHQQLVRLVNDLSKALLSPVHYSFVSYNSAVTRLAKYAIEHFSAEEQLMKEYGVDFRHQRVHLKEHDKFLEDIPKNLATAEMNSRVSHDGLVEYLINWLVTHILHIDQCMARQIAFIQAGASPQSAYNKEKSIQIPSINPLLGAVKTLMNELNRRSVEQHFVNERVEEAVMLRTRELEEFNLHLRQLSTQDELTGLPNRRYALMTLKRIYAEHQRYKSSFAILLLDADGFKGVNDTFGHDTGDKVLKALSQRLKRIVRDSDIVCRLGGDEFLIICPQTCRDGAKEIGNKIIDTKSPFLDESGELCWDGSVSLGISVSSPDGLTSYQGMLIEADKALYQSKRGGKDTMSLFTEIALGIH